MVGSSMGRSKGGVRRATAASGLLLFLATASSFPPSVQTFQQPTFTFSLQQQQQQHQRTRPSPRRAYSSSLQSMRTASSKASSSSSSLSAVSRRQTFAIDGGELQSFLLHNNVAASRGSEQIGCLRLVTGTTEDDDSRRRRVVGVERGGGGDSDDADGDRQYYGTTVSLGNDAEVYAHTLATIPDGVSDADAMSTAAAAAVGIHCALPGVAGVGGGGDGEVFYSGKAVVIGGNDYAVFVADGLATLGIDVSLVSAGGAKSRNEGVNVMSPSELVYNEEEDDYDEVGFASAAGQFDSLIDTLGNEQGGSVIDLLSAKHQCDKYISTLTRAQQIIKSDGVLFGPGKANSYVKSVESSSTTIPSSATKCTIVVPSPGFGPSTLQALLENGVLFSSKNAKAATAVRGWTMKDFWEETSWPRDSSGTGLRYGLPVADEEDLDERFQMEQIQMQRARVRVGSEVGGGMDEKEVHVQTRVDEKNPYVTQIAGVEGLSERIISERRSGVVFVAMRSCRTCKGINPVFTRMAREGADGDLMFAKADASGKVGKALGKSLGIVAVPSFVLFRNGVRYGAVSASKLPSDRLDKALRDMEAGEEFDASLAEEDGD